MGERVKARTLKKKKKRTSRNLKDVKMGAGGGKPAQNYNLLKGRRVTDSSAAKKKKKKERKMSA